LTLKAVLNLRLDEEQTYEEQHSHPFFPSTSNGVPLNLRDNSKMKPSSFLLVGASIYLEINTPDEF
jgi:hypothetical protein